MRIAIRHELKFSVDDGTSHAVQHLLLTPRDTPAQKIIEWDIKMPGFESAAGFTDAFGNIAHLVSQTRPEDDLFISVSGIVDTFDTNGVMGRLTGDAPIALFKRLTAQTKPNGNLVNRMRGHAKTGMSRVDQLHWLMSRLHEARESQPDDDEDLPEIMAEDHAHVFIAAARGMDIPARFVTGYILDDGAGPVRLHAWAEAWDDGLGWIGFDPSANLCPTPAYVRVACGLDAETALPVRMVPGLSRTSEDAITVTRASASQSQQQSGTQEQ